MAVYKIFPEKDATLYSEYPAMNTGIDEIIEATTGMALDGSPTVSRFLVQFNQSQIKDVINNKVSGSFKTFFKTYIAKATGLSEEVEIYNFTVSGSWAGGTGKYKDLPETQNGVSWDFRNGINSNSWKTSSFGSSGATASFQLGYEGGGNWYTSSNFIQSASIQYRSDFDISFDVTNTTLAWFSESIQNNGFLVKQEDNAEFNLSRSIELKYFSVDTNTIYPPELEFRWSDFIFNTGSSNQNIIDTADLVATLPNNTGTFFPESIQRFRINVRPQFPPRVFTTSSFYITNYYLPTASYWSIKDLNTNEVVINFDSTYTKISADNYSSYFDIYMNGLEPERYYQILIKTEIDGTIKILDDKYYFKVINE